MGKKNLPQGLFTASIVALSHDGRGIAKVDGKTTFIPFALPNEVVEFEYTYRKSNYDEGRMVNVIEASNDRVEPPCEHFQICGGCALQHLSVEAQLLHKQATLANHFKHFGKVEPMSWLPPLHSPLSEGYRHKARLGVRYVHKKGKVLIGFRERNGRYLAEIDRCAVLHSSVGEQLSLLQDFVANLSNYDQIAQIEVAVDDHRTALTIRHLSEFNESDYEKIATFAQQNNFWVYLQSKGSDTIYRYYPQAEEMPIEMSYQPMVGIDIAFGSGDFTQVNAKLNPKMIELALSLLEVNDQDSVLDLFCGLGNFSLPLATKAKYVVGVESDEVMTKRALKNAEDNGLSNIEFHQANLFEPITQFPFVTAQKFNKLLLDPPRAGAESVCLGIHHIDPEVIVYVSCDPSTLARDAGILVNQHGYKLIKAGVMDMFPHTNHVESIALFTK